MIVMQRNLCTIPNSIFVQEEYQRISELPQSGTVELAEQIRSTGFLNALPLQFRDIKGTYRVSVDTKTLDQFSYVPFVERTYEYTRSRRP